MSPLYQLPVKFPTSFKIRPRAIERINKGKALTRHMSAIIYKKYIKSPEWQEKVQKYRKNNCEICGSNIKLSLHHMLYSRLMFETDNDLATLCNYCHLANHIDIVSLKKLKSPSGAIRRIILRIRNNKYLKRNQMAIFLRRRYIAKYGDKKIPEMNFFRNFYDNYIKDNLYPFNFSISKM